MLGGRRVLSTHVSDRDGTQIAAFACPERGATAPVLMVALQATRPELTEAAARWPVQMEADRVPVTITGDDVARVAKEFSLLPRDQPTAEVGVSLDMPLREAREQFERQYFLHHIRREDGNMSRVADRVGLERTHLYRKLKQLGIRPSSRGEDPAA